jgi:hypothetical protein
MAENTPTQALDYEERKDVYNYAAVEQGGYCDCGIDHHKGRVTGWSKVDHDGLLNSLERAHDGVTFELVPTDDL